MEAYLAKIESGAEFEAKLTAPRDRKGYPVGLRSLKVKGSHIIQLTERKGNQSFHRNIPLTELRSYLSAGLPLYKRIQMIFANETVEWVVNRKGQWIRQKTAKTGAPLQLAHNKPKQHLLPEGLAVPFLVHLGVMKPDGKVVAAKYDKFRQINRFLELVHDVVKKFPSHKKLSIIDFGCGKAYLTFALYHWLHIQCGREVEIIGLDLKESVVEFCEKTARDLHFDGLHFKVGSIEKMQLERDVDMVVTLHACDTATDAALVKALEWNAYAILSVPCCQHALLSQIKCGVLTPLLKHGLLKERFSALVTDAARAEQLELAGYDVDIVEFIDPEHTPKNLMIRAVKGNKRGSSEVYDKFIEFLSIHPPGI